MKLVKSDDPILHTAPQRFDFSNPPIDPQELVDTLKQAMIKHGGVGLSANQIGLPYQVFVAGDPKDPDNVIGVFNPRIVHQSDQVITVEEGCLSFPGLFLKIDRPAVIRIRYTGVDGKTDTYVYEGIPARVIQHEMDHMHGKVFTSHVSDLKLKRAKQQQAKLNRIRKKNIERAKQYG